MKLHGSRWGWRLAAAVVLATVWPASVALGCKCGFGQHVDATNASAVFVGVVEFQGFAAREERRVVNGVLRVECFGGEFVSLLRVEHAWKRAVPRWVVVDASYGYPGNCGYDLLLGRRYAFFVQGEARTQIGCGPSAYNQAAPPPRGHPLMCSQVQRV